MSIIKRVTGFKQKEELIRNAKKECETCKSNHKKLQKSANDLYNLRKDCLIKINCIGAFLDSIENLPNWFKEDYATILRNVKDFQIAVEHENEPEKLTDMYNSNGKASAIMSVGIAAGGATAIWGGTAAMSLATVLGTASTGTAISTLSGIAATNAALAWLGGGTVVAGGAGIAGGNLILALMGPIGWSVAGLSALSGIAWMRNKNRKETENLLRQIDEIKKSNEVLVRSYDSIIYLNHRTRCFLRDRFDKSFKWLSSLPPMNYLDWSDENKHNLEVALNTTSQLVQLINERISND